MLNFNSLKNTKFVVLQNKYCWNVGDMVFIDDIHIEKEGTYISLLGVKGVIPKCGNRIPINEFHEFLVDYYSLLVKLGIAEEDE